MQSSASVNLIKSKTNVYDNALRWALSIGRLLIIVTEIIVFSAFIYRFFLDRTLIDLHSKIKQEKIILDSLKDKEEIYRNIQDRVALVKNITDKSNEKIQFINDVISLTPQGITFNNFDLREGVLNIDSNVQSASSISTFIKSLKNHPRVSSVTITSITNKAEGSGINVVMIIKLKEKQ